MQTESMVGGRMPPVKGSPAQYRATRHKREAQRTRANALLLLAAHAQVLYRGVDHTVTRLAGALGFERHDLTVLRVALPRRTITLIITPRRLWHSPECRYHLLSLKRQSRKVGVKAMLVPDTALRKQPRLANATLVVAASDVGITLSQRFRLEAFVMSNAGPVSLAECASLLPEHADPTAAVLSLVHAGRLVVDISRPLTPESLLSISGQAA